MSGPGTSKYKFNPCPNCCKKKIGNILWARQSAPSDTTMVIPNLRTLADFSTITSSSYVNEDHIPGHTAQRAVKLVDQNVLYVLETIYSGYAIGSYSITKYNLSDNSVMATNSGFGSNFSDMYIDYNTSTNQIEVLCVGAMIVNNSPFGPFESGYMYPHQVWKLDASTLGLLATSNDVLTELDSYSSLNCGGVSAGTNGTITNVNYSVRTRLTDIELFSGNFPTLFAASLSGYSNHMIDYCTDFFTANKVSMSRYLPADFNDGIKIRVTLTGGNFTSLGTSSLNAPSKYIFTQSATNSIAPNIQELIFLASPRPPAPLTPGATNYFGYSVQPMGWFVNSLGQRQTMIKIQEPESIFVGSVFRYNYGGAKIFLATLDTNCIVTQTSLITRNNTPYYLRDTNFSRSFFNAAPAGGFSMDNSSGYMPLYSYDDDIPNKTSAQLNWVPFHLCFNGAGEVSRRFQNGETVGPVLQGRKI